ncbi:MAG TPA: hypothetical protein VIF09_28910 [Polyangiaceae bacterium]|jgi:hypothetical protein
MSPRTACLLVLLACVARTGSAAAQSGETLRKAEALFDQGSRLVNERHYEEACPILESAQSLVLGVGVTLYLGECYEQTGRLQKAWEEFDRARELATLRNDRRASVAAERANRLFWRLPKLRINVDATGDVSGLTITDDGAPVERTAWYRAHPVEPRTHRIRITASGREPLELSVDVPPGQDTVAVEVPPLKPLPPPPSLPVSPRADGEPVAAAPAAVPAPPPPDGGKLGTQRVAGLAVMGLGALGVGVGIVMGLQAQSKLADSNSTGHCRPDDQCDGVGLAERSSALSDATLSTVGFVGGAVCVLGGGALFLMAPKVGDSQVAVVPRTEAGGASLLLRGRW